MSGVAQPRRACCKVGDSVRFHSPPSSFPPLLNFFALNCWYNLALFFLKRRMKVQFVFAFPSVRAIAGALPLGWHKAVTGSSQLPNEPLYLGP